VVKEHSTLAAIKKEGKKVSEAEVEEAEKAGMDIEKYRDIYPSEWNCYFEFNDQGELENIVFDGTQYYPGHHGPVAQISVHEDVTLKEIENEIGEALFNAEIFEEE
jgi:hypothetical protein